MLKPWNLHQLKDAAIADLSACNTALERQCCSVINNRQIRETAAAILEIRNLTPGEWAIANAAGFC